MRSVPRSEDFLRVRDLPTRAPEASQELIDALTQHYATPQGTQKLFGPQALAIADAHDNGGALIPLGVGHGKTLISFLAPVAMDAKKPVLLVPAALLKKTQIEYDAAKQHWRVHPDLKIVTYETLSSQKNREILHTLAPDVLVCDEAHALRDTKSARTRRFLDYFRTHRDARLVALSGTVTKKSLLDFWHLVRLTHHEHSPLPLSWTTTCDWDAAIGDTTRWGYVPTKPGVLDHFAEQFGAANAREGFAQRLRHTCGVVTALDDSAPASIALSTFDFTVPEAVDDALSDLKKYWRTPSGEEIGDPLTYARVATQISCGFYYRWVWPGGVVDHEWIDKRALWHQEMRKILQRFRRGADTPGLLEQAIIRGDIASEHYAKWCQVRDRFKPHPPVEAVWLDNSLIRQASKFNGIVWYDYRAIGDKLREFGMRVFEAGAKDSSEILTYSKPFAASISAHGEGKNLQHMCRNLVLTPPASGATWQQLIGRTHRHGQEADVVAFCVAAHTEHLRDTLRTALENAQYLRDITGQPQKLLLADFAIFT